MEKNKYIPKIEPGESVYLFSEEKEDTKKAISLCKSLINNTIGNKKDLASISELILNEKVASNLKSFLKLKYKQFNDLKQKYSSENGSNLKLKNIEDVALSLYNTKDFLFNQGLVNMYKNPNPTSNLQSNLIGLNRSNQNIEVVENNRLTNLDHDILSHGVYAKILEDIGIILPRSFSELDETLVRGIDAGLSNIKRYKYFLKRQIGLDNFPIHSIKQSVEKNGFEYDYTLNPQDQIFEERLSWLVHQISLELNIDDEKNSKFLEKFTKDSNSQYPGDLAHEDLTLSFESHLTEEYLEMFREKYKSEIAFLNKVIKYKAEND
ncbi:MAG: hypothetical protein AAGF07_01295 [Patescibacteria group bacterium]